MVQIVGGRSYSAYYSGANVLLLFSRTIPYSICFTEKKVHMICCYHPILVTVHFLKEDEGEADSTKSDGCFVRPSYCWKAVAL